MSRGSIGDDGGPARRRAADAPTARTLLGLAHAIDRLNRFVGRAMLWPLLASVAISAGNAISRKLFSLSSNGWLEIQWHLFALAFLGSAGYVLMVDEHVRIDALSRFFAPRVNAAVDAVALVLVALPMTVLFAVFGWTVFMNAWRIGEASFNAGGLTVWPIYLCIPLGMALLGLQAVSELIRRIGFLRGWCERPTLGEADLPPMLGERAAKSAG